jgi:hypothetical protein
MLQIKQRNSQRQLSIIALLFRIKQHSKCLHEQYGCRHNINTVTDQKGDQQSREHRFKDITINEQIIVLEVQRTVHEEKANSQEEPHK